jgi:cytochrome bd ubiquinol oxidase subunit I
MSGAALVGDLVSAGGAQLSPVDQQYLFEARQMQALSLAVHIPLVCFGIAFPAMVLFTEWRYLRTGDPLFRTLANRWSKVMLALFAVGVVTGTTLASSSDSSGRASWPASGTCSGSASR